MAAKTAPAQTNPCCAALQLKCSKLEEKRNALRQGCHILKEQLVRLEADNGALKKAYDEERARADLERKNNEKETSLRISMESKVTELESQLYSLQQVGSSKCEYLDKELKTVQEKVSEREAEIGRLKQFLEEEKRKANVERENAKIGRQKAIKLSEALEAQKNRAKETSNYTDTIDGSENKKATLLQYKELADGYKMKLIEEQSYTNNLLKQLEDETVKVELLQKEVIALKSFDESAEAHFAMLLSEKEAELNHELLEVEQSRADLEQKKAGALQEALELEKIKCLESSNMTHDESIKSKESLLKIEGLNNEVEKLTLELLECKDMNKKYEAEKQEVLWERQCAALEKVKAIDLKKLAEENEKRLMEEKSNSQRLLKQVKEERKNVETLQKQVQELLELKEAYSKLEIENRRLMKDKELSDRLKAEELKTLAEEKDKKIMDERSSSKQLAQQMEGERQKMEMLQKQVKELLSTAKSTASAHSDYMELKEAHTRLESQNRMLTWEKKRIEAEKGKVDELRKLSEANQNKYFEEKCRADSSSHELETCKQKLKELKEELCNLKLSKKLVGSSRLPDVNNSTQVLLHEQLKLEKKRVKHAKEVLKLEKNRNSVLQGQLRKLKQDFIQTVQHMDMLEKTFCGGTQEADKSTKSSDLSKLESLYLNKMLFGSNQFDALENGRIVLKSSVRRASDSAIPTTVYSQLVTSTGSPSGITATLHPLVGGHVREISPISPMDSSAASFPDKHICSAQDQLVGSNATSTIVTERNPKKQVVMLKHSDQIGKRKNHAHIEAVVDNSMGSPYDSLCVHSKKKRKLLNEIKSLKCGQSESRRLHQELEKKISKMHSKLNMLMPMEDANVLRPGNVASLQDRPRKKRRDSHKSEETLDHSDYLAKQINRDNALARTSLPPIKEGRSAQACIDDIRDQDTLLIFEQQIQGNVMKLLELDNEVDEELFRSAMGNLLSPSLPEINCEISELVGVDLSGGDVDESDNHSLLICTNNVVSGVRGMEKTSMPKSCHPLSCSIDLGTYKHIDLEKNKKDGTGVGTNILMSAPVSTNDCTKQTNRCKLGETVDTIPVFCILFSYMKDIVRIRMMLFATKRFLAQCFLHSQSDRILMELLTALASEQQLTPREKVCVFFALTMYNLFQESSNESDVYINQGSSCSFPSYLCSVLSDGEKKGILPKSFCISEFLHLFEDFIYQRRILFCGDKYADAKDTASRFEVLLDGTKTVLYERTASTHEVFAGSVIFSSICLALGQISILCDVSLNILRKCPADAQLTLYILHGFAFCGGKYFMESNSSIQMEAVKSMVNVLENAPDVQAATLSQSNTKTSHQFSACTRCPFATSLQPLDILSLLVDELGKYASTPMDGVNLSSSFLEPDYESNNDIYYYYIDIMSSVELVSMIMGWRWTSDKILPELRKLRPLFIQGNFSVALVLLLGRLGRAGIKSGGYEDAGVKTIRQHLSSLSQQIPFLEQNQALASALFSALDGISLQNKENTPSATFMRECYSSLSSEKKCLISALKQTTSQ